VKRLSIFIYGLACYAVFFATFLYAIGWVGNLPLPVTIDAATLAPTGIALLTLFAVQHSVMARPAAPRDLAPTHAGNRLRLVSCVGNQWGQTRLIRQSYI
jgi:hypothetical protein